MCGCRLAINASRRPLPALRPSQCTNAKSLCGAMTPVAAQCAIWRSAVPAVEISTRPGSRNKRRSNHNDCRRRQRRSNHGTTRPGPRQFAQMSAASRPAQMVMSHSLAAAASECTS